MSPDPGQEERTLVLRAQDGETTAFEQLVDRHQGRLFRIAFTVVGDRQEAEDLVQETLVLAWRRLHLLEELARHAGHADLVRENLDGATMYELVAAREGWPATDWLTPWSPRRAQPPYGWDH